jgi:predicted nucleic-acid-binding Zn-ribbon protein
MKNPVSCPNCQSRNLYKTNKPVASGGGYGPNLLPGLGRWFREGRFDLLVCRDCGLTQFFVHEEDRGDLDDSKKWERL